MKTEKDCFKTAIVVANKAFFTATYLMTDKIVLKKSILQSFQKDVRENLRMEKTFVQKFIY